MHTALTQLYETVVERAIAPVLVGAGFTRRRGRFDLETQAAVATVKLQRSTGATRFTLHGGVGFRAVANCCYGDEVMKDCLKHGMAFTDLRRPSDPNIEHWFDMEATPDSAELGEDVAGLLRSAFLPEIRERMRPRADRALLLRVLHETRGLDERPLTRLYFWLRHLGGAPQMDSVRASLARVDAPMVGRIDKWSGPAEWLGSD